MKAAQRRFLQGLASGAALLLTAGRAAAHSPIEGLGSFFNGALHVLLEPALLLALLPLGLLIGQACEGRLARSRRPLVAYVLALLAGLALQQLAGHPQLDRLLLLCGGLAGVLVASAARLPSGVLASLAVVIGASVGLSAGLGAGPAPMIWRELVIGGLGTVLGMLLLPSWLVVVVQAAQRPWQRIVARVLGSWVAAVALLVLSLSFARVMKA